MAALWKNFVDGAVYSRFLAESLQQVMPAYDPGYSHPIWAESRKTAKQGSVNPGADGRETGIGQMLFGRRGTGQEKHLSHQFLRMG
jgi:hypothetical protein